MKVKPITEAERLDRAQYFYQQDGFLVVYSRWQIPIGAQPLPLEGYLRGHVWRIISDATRQDYIDQWARHGFLPKVAQWPYFYRMEAMD